MYTLLDAEASLQDVRELFAGAEDSHGVFAGLDFAPFSEAERHVRKSETVGSSPWTVGVRPSSPPQGRVL